MRYILIMMTLLCSLVGCSKDPLDDIAPSSTEGLSAVTFGVVSNEIEAAAETRSTVLLGIYESKLYNYNIFCYHTATSEEQHYYSSSETASTLMLENGDWEVYVFANTDNDMSDMSREEVENYTYTIAKTTDLTTGYRLVMVHNSTVSVNGNTTINLEVERLVARFDIDIEFSGEAANYELVRTEVVNGAASCKVFRDNTPTSSTVETFTNFITGHMVFYTMENLQGVMSGITRPEDKNEHNAPANATHIKIYAESSTHEIVYTYYLGGNTINDFDIERNTSYEIAININGMNPEDMRVESTKIPIDPVYEIYGDHSKFVTIDTFHEADGWTLYFESDEDQTIDLEIVSNSDNSDEIDMAYLGILIEESHYQGGFMPINDFTNLMEYNILQPFGSGSEYYYLSNYVDNDNATIATEVKATVKSGVKYRLLVGRWNWTTDYSRNDLRLYMNRGTANEKYVDLKFETTLDADVVIDTGSEHGWELNFEVEGQDYVDVEFVASASSEDTPYYGFLMTELHYLINGANWATDDFLDKTPLRSYNYPDASAIIISDNMDDLFPNSYSYATNHAYAKLQCGISYRLMIRNTNNPYDKAARQGITIYVERGTPNEQEYYLPFETIGS